MSPFIKSFGFFVAGLVALINLGCGGSDSELDLVPVTGIVKLDDAPLPNALVTFYPEDTKGFSATATTDEEGKFSLTTKNPGDGAIVGKHKVTVRERPPEQSEEITSGDAYEPTDPKAASKIPLHFSRVEESGISKEVTASGDNDFVIELKSK